MKNANQPIIVFLTFLIIVIVIVISTNLSDLVGQAPKAVPSKFETTGTGSFRGSAPIRSAAPSPVLSQPAPQPVSPQPITPQNQPITSFSSPTEDAPNVIPPESEDFDGYIVELQTPSLLEVNAKIEKEIKNSDDQIARVDNQIQVHSLRASVAPSNLQESKTVLEEHKNQKIQEQQMHKQYLAQEKAAFIASITPSQSRVGAAIRTMTGAPEPPQIKVKESFDVAVNGLLVEGTAVDIATLKNNPQVKRITPNYKIYPMLVDSVSAINAVIKDDQGNVFPIDADGNNCQQTGKPCMTGQGIRIGVLDTGVDYGHAVFGSCNLEQITDNNPATCPKFGPSFDFYGDGVTTDNNPMDVAGHGTHVAATTAGKGTLPLPDGRRIDGVAPDATIYAYKVFGLKNGVVDGNSGHVIAALGRAADLDGDGRIGVAEGIDNNDPDGDGIFAKDDRLDVIVLSLGGKGDADDAMSRAIDNAVGNGIIAVIAAGNEGPDSETVGSPGAARKALTVGSTCDKFYSWQKDGLTFRRCIHGPDSISKFSSRGPAPGGTIKPDVLAPGELITAAWPQLTCTEAVAGDLKSPTGFCTIQGTSMATPHVAGAAALLKQKNPTWIPEQIKAALKITSKNLALPESEQGAGRVDVIRALQLAIPPPVVSLKIPAEIKGTVSLADKITATTNYELSYAPRASPESKTIIAGPTFDSTTIPDGDYFIKATVTENGMSYSDAALVNVNNVVEIPALQITHPPDKAILLGGPIQVRGNNYLSGTLSLEYGRGLSPQSWTPVLTNVNVGDTLFGTVDTSSIIEEDFYTIKARAGSSEATVAVYIVPPRTCSDTSFYLMDNDGDSVHDDIKRCNCDNGQCALGTCTGTECKTTKKITIEPEGGSISFAGKTITTPQSVDLPIGGRSLLNGVKQSSSIRFTLERWDPPVPNSIVTVTTDMTYKPIWKAQQQQLTIGSKPAGAGSLNIPSTTWQDIGGTVQISVQPSGTAPFIEWQDCTTLTCTCISKNPTHDLQMNVQTTRERFIIALFDPNTPKVCQ